MKQEEKGSHGQQIGTTYIDSPYLVGKQQGLLIDTAKQDGER